MEKGKADDVACFRSRKREGGATTAPCGALHNNNDINSDKHNQGSELLLSSRGEGDGDAR